ncbi:hypothetical protein N7493_004233 [Penicillium malachiteum]|uniref:Uncharacterized protein n=1 Tax=Penicillium malachiteum TaxID=1324776 RepID=A0AAD6HR54_9EURO|nr:hypothetical protein N7493_004233 [Penicillium malachiteum]
MSDIPEPWPTPGPTHDQPDQVLTTPEAVTNLSPDQPAEGLTTPSVITDPFQDFGFSRPDQTGPPSSLDQAVSRVIRTRREFYYAKSAFNHAEDDLRYGLRLIPKEEAEYWLSQCGL